MATKASAVGPLTKIRIDGVFVYVQDFQMMLAFYRDTLGFAVTYSNDHFASMRTRQGAELDLHDGRNSSADQASHWFLHITVDDIEATSAELNSLGVEVSEIKEEAYGRIAEFKDPEGNAIGLEEPPAHEQEDV